MKRVLVFVCIAFLGLFLFPFQAWTATYYVANSSAGSGLGTPDYANRASVSYHNAGSGVFGALDGDTVYLCDNITSQVTVPDSGSSGNYVTYRGDYASHAGIMDFFGNPMFYTNSKDYIIIDGVTLRNGNTGIKVYFSDHVTVKNCTIHTMQTKGIFCQDSTNITFGGADGDGNDIYNVGIDTGGTDISFQRTVDFVVSYNKLYAVGTARGIDGVATHHSHEGLIEYNTMYSHNKSGGGEDGIDLKESSHNIIIRYNHIYDHQYQTGITVQLSCYDIYIYGNSVHDNRTTGVYIKRGNSSVHDVEDIHVWGNLLYNNASGVFVAASGDSTKTIRRVYVYNNTIVENGNHSGTVQSRGVGIQMGTGHIVKNNIFYKNHGVYGDNIYEQVYIYSSASTTFDYNYYYYPGTSGQDMFDVAGSDKTFAEWQGLGKDANGTEGNPGFEDAVNEDYVLASGSACIDNGIDLSGLVASVTIQGTIYSMYWDDCLSTKYTDWATIPPTARSVKQDNWPPAAGAWEQGAYVYDGEVVEYPNGVIDTPASSPLQISTDDVVNFTGTASGGTSPYTHSWLFDGAHPAYAGGSDYDTGDCVTDGADTCYRCIDGATCDANDPSENPALWSRRDTAADPGDINFPAAAEGYTITYTVTDAQPQTDPTPATTIISVQAPPGTYIDWTGGTWAETDSGTDITVAANTITVDTMETSAVSYVVEDFTANYFGNFTHDFQVNITVSSGLDAAGAFWALTDQSAPTIKNMDDNDDGIALFWKQYDSGGSDRRIVLINYENNTSDYYSASLATTYYLTIVKDDTTLKAYIYSDSGRTNLLDTLSVTRTADEYRYLAHACSYATAASCDVVQQAEDGVSDSARYVGRFSSAYWATKFVYSGTTAKAICIINLWLKRVGSPTRNYYAAIWGHDAGNDEPDSGNVIGTGDAVASNTVGTSEEKVEFVLSTPSGALTNGTTYWVLCYTGSYDGSNYLSWYYDDDSAGTEYVTWSNTSGVDWTFHNDTSTQKFEIVSQ